MLINVTPDELLASVYDAPFNSATAAVFSAIVANSTSGIVGRRLEQLEIEAARLAEAGETLTPDNPVVRALLADLAVAMPANVALINSASGAVSSAGVEAGLTLARALSLPGVSDDDLARLGVPFNSLDPNELSAAVGYTESDEWIAFMEQYTTGTVTQVNNNILTRIAAKQGPVKIASEVRAMVSGLPKANAEQALRTLQMVSSRDAQQAHRIANQEILEYQIRIAALDARTCMACVALHGTILPIEARIDDHHNGRCTSVTKVVGFPVPEVQSGAEWFNGLTAAQQQAQMGQEAWALWNEGLIKFGDFVAPYTDPVFGQMIGTRSLKQIQAGTGGIADFIEEREDFLSEAMGITPGMLLEGAPGDVALNMADYLAFTPEGEPMYSAESLRAGTVDLFVDVRQIGRVDPSIAQVDLIRLRASGILATDAQLPISQLSVAETNSLKKLVSNNFDVANDEITVIRDLRLKGAARGRVGGFQGDDFISAQDADNIARLLEQNQ